MDIIGRLTRDALVSTTPQDKQVVNFTVAVNDSYKNKDGNWIEQTEYFDCSFWRTPKIAKILTKGTLVKLTGRVSVRAWMGKDGEPKAGLNFRATDVDRLAKTKRAETNEYGGSESQHSTTNETEDDLPF